MEPIGWTSDCSAVFFLGTRDKSANERRYYLVRWI